MSKATITSIGALIILLFGAWLSFNYLPARNRVQHEAVVGFYAQYSKAVMSALSDSSENVTNGVLFHTYYVRVKALDLTHCPKKFRRVWLDFLNEVRRLDEMNSTGKITVELGSFVNSLNLNHPPRVALVDSACERYEVCREVALEYGLRVQ
ncbi:MAG TPA: hypothetical protein VFC07_13445 [Verrucomicrobiae bacterium]|nr:hypothetical protein [Verrucomicrobiae bacterium]